MNRVGTATAAIVGVVFGIAMYAVDMYGVARIFPSLAGLRDWMSALAYVIQGALTAALYKVMTRDVDDGDAGGHRARPARSAQRPARVARHRQAAAGSAAAPFFSNTMRPFFSRT